MVNNTPANETEVEKAFQAMLPCLKQMEEIWLDGGKKKFLIGDEITVADLLGLCELEQPGNLKMGTKKQLIVSWLGYVESYSRIRLYHPPTDRTKMADISGWMMKSVGPN